MNETTDTNTPSSSTTTAEHLGTRAPSAKHVQQACDLVNSIERTLIVRIVDIEATMQPAAVERLRFHIINALGDHIGRIASMLAAAETQCGVVANETRADGNTVEALRE